MTTTPALTAGRANARIEPMGAVSAAMIAGDSPEKDEVARTSDSLVVSAERRKRRPTNCIDSNAPT